MKRSCIDLKMIRLEALMPSWKEMGTSSSKMTQSMTNCYLKVKVMMKLKAVMTMKRLF